MRMKSVALPFREIIANEVLGGVANPNLGEEEAHKNRNTYIKTQNRENKNILN